MAGKRLLDLAAIFNASRGVAQKHVALRTRQVDVYNRTSTLARAVRNQTDRITETVKAASFLASRLNEDAPSWASDPADERKAASSHNGETIPRKKPTEVEPAAGVKDGLEQDHHYDRSPANAPLDPPPEEDLEIQQEKADRYPLSDGTIPPAEVDERAAPIDDDVVPIRPQDEPHKKPLKNEGLEPASSGASTIPLPDKKPLSSRSARVAQRNSEFQIPSKTADAYDGSSMPLREGHDDETFNKRSTHTSPELSSLPRVKIPKYPSNTQEPTNKTLNSDTFYTESPESAVDPEQEEIPEGVNIAVFHSSKIARSLGGRMQEGRVGLGDLQPSSLPKDEIHDLAKEISQEADKHSKIEASPEAPPYELRESKVPSSRLGRIWNYGGLAAGMFGGAISESIRRVGGGGGEGSYMLSAGNMERLVTKLSRMRGAALKLGQMISFQDSKMLPAPIQEVLQRVQDRADYMPPSQRDKVLTANLGSEWRELFSSFDEKPIAAASIGQVHKAVLKSNGAPVAVKVQYPGVADSIDSDLNNLATLLTASRLLPKGLFLDKTIANARTELAWECDYIREAECGQRFQELLADEEDVFVVPKVYSEASGKQVLTMEFLDGVGVTRVKSFTQEQRDWIGTQILRLCLREITEFKYMQTDPNWTNFLYNAETNKLELLDFGASREYPEEFMKRYTKLLSAASVSDRKTVTDLSIELGYLTGLESKAMLDAHIASILTLAEPFLESSPEIYDFKDQTITERVKALIPVMIRERLAPPPEETYSLHRKLSGAFLLCARLGSRVPCREMFKTSMEKANVL
ncbi:Protein ABC1-like protein, mitochondrial [Lachnellula hyalina]|uniref:Protein ABC1-like protein, mitochondrial n=1 Tax=Lachnellula hyalina TaxID=1316788 RepID=A0A8H8TZW1_9HELO|nr:Protein ABC1-like protein, mitochondrial [Lachnellula hyalina]TVY25421.1 Protein ABC1-like protein, mitochondrial [Lachnellula hyalina]